MRHRQTHSIFRRCRGSDITFQKKVTADSFYMVLPSNASLQTFPDNRPGLYRIRLPEMMHLQGHWKVGLMNLIFSNYLCPPPPPSNIDPLAIMVSLGNTETTYGPFNMTVTIIETVGDLVFATHLALEKNAAEHGLNLSNSHHHPFLSKAYTLED